MSWKSRYGKKKIRPLKPNLQPLTRAKLPENVILTDSPPDQKMSDILMEFIRPYVDDFSSEAHLNKALAVGLVAWNAAIAPAGAGQSLIESCLGTLPSEVREDGRAVIARMLQRKLSCFANIKRFILSYELTMMPHGPHLVVLSTPPE